MPPRAARTLNQAKGGLSMTRIAIVIAAALAFTATLPAVSAHAAARDRVFVASYGNDSNPCTFGSPCKTFQYAVNVVAVGGEVTAIDSAGFGPISITESVTITSPAGVEAGIVPVSGGDAITINTNGAVFSRGLTIDGSIGGYNGITLDHATSLTIVDCVIRNFTHDGIHLGPYLQSFVSILNTIASNNGNDGIVVYPGYGDPLQAVFNNVQSINNGAVGFDLMAPSGSSGALSITIENSLASNNTGNGITAGLNAYLFLQNSVVMLNLNGVSSQPGGVAYLSNNLLIDNQTDALLNGGSIYTYSNNECFNNCSRSASAPAPF